MSRRMPSMVALLGLLAVAGYQNRDKLSQMLEGAPRDARNPGGSDGPAARAAAGSSPGLLEELGNLFRSSSAGSALAEGLGSVVDRFRGAGHAEVAESWVGSGTNKSLTPQLVEQAIDPDTMTELEQKTGLSRSEILQRLSLAIPDAVNHFTPQGRLPDEAEAQGMV